MLKKRVLFRGHGKCCHLISTQCGSRRNYPVRTSGSPPVTRETPSVRNRRLPIRQHGMTSHRHDRQRGIVSEYSWMNEWFVSSVNMSCHLPPKQRSSSQHYPLSGFLCSMSAVFQFPWKVTLNQSILCPWPTKKKKRLSQCQCDDWLKQWLTAAFLTSVEFTYKQPHISHSRFCQFCKL